MTHWLKSALNTLLLAGLFSIASVARTAAAATTNDAVITVSPVADVSLTLNVTSYAFGSLAVNSSTNSATALTLTNTGQVSISVDKRIVTQSNPAGWTAGNAVGRDAYVLYCATSSARMALSDFGSATPFGIQGNISNLTGPSGTQPIMPTQGTGQSLDLWFRLDMPTQLSSAASRTITIRFTGTAQ